MIAPGVLGPVTFSSPSMVNDVNRWLADPSSNFGWIILGDETVYGSQLSSKRGFATHEHAIEAYRPLLTFEYTVAAVPEPASLPLAAASIILLLLCPRSQARLSTRNPLFCDASEGPADKDAQGEIEHASSGGC